MGKIRTRKILFVVAAMLLCVLVAVLIRLFFSNRIVRMTLTPIEVEVGEAVHYADSTRNASSWLWEFGNGDVSHERSGQYVFKEPGRYQVRLQVDHSLEKKQIVKVNRRANNYGSDQLVKIEARRPPSRVRSFHSRGTGRRGNGAGSSVNRVLWTHGSRIRSMPTLSRAGTRCC